MQCDLKFSVDLTARLEAAAEASDLTVEELIVVATAEKLARLEHKIWLGSHAGKAADDGGPTDDKS